MSLGAAISYATFQGKSSTFAERGSNARYYGESAEAWRGQNPPDSQPLS